MSPVRERQSAQQSRAGSSVTTTETKSNVNSTTNSTGPILRLRAEQDEGREERRIQWADDVVDNEGLGRKSSKVCCIYHKPKNAGDASSDESSSSDSSTDTDSEPDLSRAQSSKRKTHKRAKHEHEHDHEHGHACEQDDKGSTEIILQGTEHVAAKGSTKGKDRAVSPNAYERVPKRKPA